MTDGRGWRGEMVAAQPTIIATSISFQLTGGSVWDGMPGPASPLATTLARAAQHPGSSMRGTRETDHPAYPPSPYFRFRPLDPRLSRLRPLPLPCSPLTPPHLL